MFPELLFEDEDRLQAMHVTCGMRLDIRLNSREQKIRFVCYPCNKQWSVAPSELKEIEVASLVLMLEVT